MNGYHHINHESSHVASVDAQASAILLQRYFDILELKRIKTFSDLGSLKNYKFVKSFHYDPFRDNADNSLPRCKRLFSRVENIENIENIASDPARHALGEYWDELRTVIADLDITDDEVIHLVKERERLGLAKEQIRVLHARAFSSVISQFVDDQWIDDRESAKLRRLHRCLSRLG